MSATCFALYLKDGKITPEENTRLLKAFEDYENASTEDRKKFLDILGYSLTNGEDQEEDDIIEINEDLENICHSLKINFDDFIFKLMNIEDEE
jgi:hypothetical protein